LLWRCYRTTLHYPTVELHLIPASVSALTVAAPATAAMPDNSKKSNNKWTGPAAQPSASLPLRQTLCAAANCEMPVVQPRKTGTHDDRHGCALTTSAVSAPQSLVRFVTCYHANHHLASRIMDCFVHARHYTDYDCAIAVTYGLNDSLHSWICRWRAHALRSSVRSPVSAVVAAIADNDNEIENIHDGLADTA